MLKQQFFYDYTVDQIFSHVRLDRVKSNVSEIADADIPVLVLNTFQTAVRCGIVTRAAVCWHRGSERVCTEHDFRKEVHYTPACHVTQKRIDKHHAAVLAPAKLESIIAEVRKYYASGMDILGNFHVANTGNKNGLIN